MHTQCEYVYVLIKILSKNDLIDTNIPVKQMYIFYLYAHHSPVTGLYFTCIKDT